MLNGNAGTDGRPRQGGCPASGGIGDCISGLSRQITTALPRTAWFWLTARGAIFIDTMQYHPTDAVYPRADLGQLVTEKVRTLGAQLVNSRGEQFIMPLEPRDVVTSAIIRECKERGLGLRTPNGEMGVWLDSPMIDMIRGEGTIARELPAMVRQYRRFTSYRSFRFSCTDLWLSERRHQDKH